MERCLEKVVSFRKCSSYEIKSIKDSVNKCLSDIGGLGFIKGGCNVLLKPNFLRSDPHLKGIITHPVFIRAVAEIFLEHGCRVKVGDSAGIGKNHDVLKKCGYLEYLKELPIELVEFENPVTVKNNSGVFRNLEIDREVLETDALVSLPKVKTHGQMRLTLALKNIYGCMPGLKKPQWHLNAGIDYMSFAGMLAEYHYLVNPTLHIVDGIVGMDGDGPGAGDKIKLGFVGASRDARPLDFYIAKILKVDPYANIVLKACVDKSLGWDEKEVRLAGDPMSGFEIERKFILPKTYPLETFGHAPYLGKFLKDALTVKPHIVQEKCILCLECLNQCAAKVMTVAKNSNKEFIRIDHRNCIRCFCCQEICPQAAIKLKSGWLLRLVEALK